MNSTEPNTIDELIRQANELLYQIKCCEDYYVAWNELRSAMRTNSKAVHLANDFFAVAFEALNKSTMTEIIKLYDNHRECMSVVNLYQRCTSTKDIYRYLSCYPHKLERYKDTVTAFASFLGKEETDQVLANLRIRRDKYYMHNDRKYFKDTEGCVTRELVDKAPFSFDNAEELLEKAFEFCGALYELLSGSEWKPCLHQNCFVHERDFSGLRKLLDLCQTNAALE